jgi:hypothetical protein
MKAMYPIILITALIFVPVIIGAICTVAGFRAYRARRQLQHDVERAHNLDDTPPTNENDIEMRNLENNATHRSWPVSRNQPDIVRPNLAPAIKPLPVPKIEIKGVRGGFVEHWEPSSSKSSMLPDSDMRYEYAQRHVGKKEKENENFENADLYADPGWNSHKEHSVSVEADIPAPQLLYIGALYGRYDSVVGPKTRMYGEDARAAVVWAKIERRESLTTTRVPQAVEEKEEEEEEEEFEDVDLDGDSKFTPVFAVESGSTGEEHADGEEGRVGYMPGHTLESCHSFSSERSLTHCGSFPAADQLARKLSWSMTSSHPSRRSMESTREDVAETPHPTQPVCRGVSATSKRTYVVNPFANRASNELRRPELVEYSDSDSEPSR